MKVMMTLVALALLSGPALACDAVTRIVSIAPADGAVDVPVNAQIVVFHERTLSGLSVTLTGPAGGAQVPASVAVRSGGLLEELAPSVAVVVPSQPLSPNTTYTITLEGPSMEYAGQPATSAELHFTTGADQDVTPPTFNGLNAVTGQVLADDGASSACDAGPERWSLTVTSAAPSPDAVAYALVRNGFTVATSSKENVVYQALPEGGTSQICLSLRAIDQAGNVSTGGTETCVRPADFGAEPVDPGTDPGTDSGSDTWLDTGTGWVDTWRPTDTGDRPDTAGWDRPVRTGCDQGTVRLCGPALPSSPITLVPMLGVFALLRRRR